MTTENVTNQQDWYPAFLNNWYKRRKRIFVELCIALFIIAVIVMNILDKHTWNVLIRRTKYGFKVCKPRTDIVFLKTHKCASSSIQNIILRYGDLHNLTFALPHVFNYFGHPDLFRRDFVIDYSNRSFNILAHHTRYNRPEMDLVMPEGTVYVTIVRSPIDLLKSLYIYCKIDQVYKMDLATLSLNRTGIEFLLAKNRHTGRFGLNQMSFDLGLNYSQFENQTAIEKLCLRIDLEFDLVMVYERLEESLVLLSDLLCWSLEDVAVFQLNGRTEELKKGLPKEAIRILEELSAADVALYKHFSKKFQLRIEDYGVDRMKNQVARLREITRSLQQYCIVDSFTGKNVHGVPIVSYHVRNNSLKCERMLREELVYADMLREKQHIGATLENNISEVVR